MEYVKIPRDSINPSRSVERGLFSELVDLCAKFKIKNPGRNPSEAENDYGGVSVKYGAQQNKTRQGTHNGGDYLGFEGRERAEFWR